MLLKFLQQIPDKRRPQGRQFGLGEILFFSILAILSGANSYRKISIFIKNNFDILVEKYELKWKNKPGYTTIRNIIQAVDKEKLEENFRLYSIQLSKKKVGNLFTIGIDGKVLRGSFDHFCDQKAIQILSAFTNTNLILAHEKIDEKTMHPERSTLGVKFQFLKNFLKNFELNE